MLSPVKLWALVISFVALAASCSDDVDDRSQSAQDQAMPSGLVLLFDNDPDAAFDAAEYRGTLVVDFPCVFGEQVVDGATVRTALFLPDGRTEYDSATDSVRVGDGPWLATGDPVRGGGSHVESGAGLCPSDDSFRSVGLEAAP